MRPSQLLGVSTSACIAAASPRAAAGPPAGPAAAADAGEAEAKRLYDARMYPEAAQAFEALHAGSRAPKHLFNAAMARELAGHEGHAYLLLRRYLATPDLPPAEAARAQDRLDALQRRTVATRLVIAPVEAAGEALEISVERAASGSPAEAGRAPLVLRGELLPLLVAPGRAGEYDLQLERGAWTIVARAPGFAAARQEVSVLTGEAQITLALPTAPPAALAVTASFGPPEALARGIEVTLTPGGGPARAERVERAEAAWQLAPGAYRLEARAPGFLPIEASFEVGAEPVALDVRMMPEPVVIPPPPTRRDRWVLGLSIGGGASAVAGAVMLGLGGARWSTTIDRYGEHLGAAPEAWLVDADRLVASWKLYGAGGGLLGAGLGLGLGAAGMAAAPRLKRPAVMWGVATGLGAALAVAGGLVEGRAGARFEATLLNHRDRFAALDGAAAGDLRGAQHRVGAAGAMIGLGAGVALSGVLGLIRGARPATTTVAPTGTGVVLTARF